MSAAIPKKIAETGMTIAIAGFVAVGLVPPNQDLLQFTVTVIWILAGFLIRDIWVKP